MANIRRNQIAFRCPECGTATVGFLGGLSSVSDMLRLKCECQNWALEIKKLADGKLHLSVPCVFCKDTHGYTVSAGVINRDEPTMLACPYASMDILFMGDEVQLPRELERSAKELERILASFEAEDLHDIQPLDIDENDAPPDPSIFDSINFIVRDLEAEGKVHCPCGQGEYELRFCDEGMQVYCTHCGTSYTFYAKTQTAAEEYLGLDEITLG